MLARYFYSKWLLADFRIFEKSHEKKSEMIFELHQDFIEAMGVILQEQLARMIHVSQNLCATLANEKA